MEIKKLLIANRGEIAVRIIKAAKELNIKTVQVYSMADKDSLAVKLADESIEIGSPKASDSYLNIDKIIHAAKKLNADAIHPGYGFLAENAKFAQRVADEGLIFVGPRADIISQLGDKVTARNIAEKAGVPVVPGSDGVVKSVEEGLQIANQIIYPVLIKASAGGGGRGIRVAHNDKEFFENYHEASSEAKAAFGNGDLYVEKVIVDARHIEVQVLGDGENFVHCYERDCSLQRRRQKVWEEAPANILDNDTRERICSLAVALIASVNYEGAGTVEYLYDSKNNSFYFIEVNTRIQVEHPITECITGIDLVQEMIKIAAGCKLSFKQEEVIIKGHAIECRINAEDPYNQFMPFPGTVNTLKLPTMDNVRFDTFLYEGYSIPPFYDSLIGKVIVKADTRSETIELIHHVLEKIKIEGVKTTVPLHIALAKNDEVKSGLYDINWLEKWLNKSFTEKNTQSN